MEDDLGTTLQIMMNAIWEATTVTMTPIVPTSLEALHVPANLAFQEMESLAQVNKARLCTSVFCRQKNLAVQNTSKSL